MQTGNRMLPLSEACKELSISLATGQNWVKRGKLVPSAKIGRSLFFSRAYVERFKADIQSGKDASLKSRRNKKYVSGNQMYHSYLPDGSRNRIAIQSLVSVIENRQIEVTDGILCMLVAECAVQLLRDKYGRAKRSQGLLAYLSGKLDLGECSFLVEDIIRPYPLLLGMAGLYPELFGSHYVYEEGEDVLGLLYISLKNMGNRKASGAYYTPAHIVKALCSRLFCRKEAKGWEVQDPCCGTGNFILQLPPGIPAHHVFGNDVDAISVKIARINYALKYGITDAAVIYSHITEGDYLLEEPKRHYDVIIGNPPWGYGFSEAQKKQLREKYTVAAGAGIESYDVFIEQALRQLKPDGILSFVLPEAILHVKSHALIRQRMLDACTFQYIGFLGNAFDGVQCPSLILQAALTGDGSGRRGMVGTVVNDGAQEYTIQTRRKVGPEGISLPMTDEEYAVIRKMDGLPGKATLAGQAAFALGIVTGDNKEWVKKEKSGAAEMVLKGLHLSKFKYKPSDCYLTFRPEAFQQTAPSRYYRAKEKLLYRFICSQLVFAYDDAQVLPLNSCNVLIPEIEGLQVKYILAVLNAGAVQFYYKKKFQSVKILRSHLEEIPIPPAAKETQDKIVGMVDAILGAHGPEAVEKWYGAIEHEVAKLYGLTAEECRLIQHSLEGENRYLPTC
ncbi:MAG: N-6 DNA methylase [Lachnospiraceae bacterium]|jgi:predicted RNA methylase|nr:N-6 DNA methylase [Lachnospiraceae bacterium]